MIGWLLQIVATLPALAALLPAATVTAVSEPVSHSVVRQEAPVHYVNEGDTIHAVAAWYGVSAAALVQHNGLRGSRLWVGQELRIPTEPLPPVAPVAQPVGAAAVIDRGVTSRLSVALTFDAGADRGYAEAILNVLRDRGVRASFGMTGIWARQNPDLVVRMVDEGHRLINHSWDHGSFTGLSTRTRALTREERWAQLDRTEALIYDLTGQSTLPLFRSPYGDWDNSVQRDLGARGYTANILWTVDSTGWTGASARQIIDRCLRGARPGAIYVMHVGAGAQDGPALPWIIDGLAAAGYDFETIDEILAE